MLALACPAYNTPRIYHLYQDPHETDPRQVLWFGDLTDSTSRAPIRGHTKIMVISVRRGRDTAGMPV